MPRFRTHWGWAIPLSIEAIIYVSADFSGENHVHIRLSKDVKVHAYPLASQMAGLLLPGGGYNILLLFLAVLSCAEREGCSPAEVTEGSCT